MDKISKTELVRKILDDYENDITDEEVIHLMLEKKLASNEERLSPNQAFGQIAAEKMAGFTGSWFFVISFCAAIISWMAVNVYFFLRPFDPYPFTFLNLVLSCIAAIQAPLIMMSQNREEAKDRKRSENDYKVNLKTEIIIEDLHFKIDKLLENHDEIIKLLKEQQII